jgi:hypothetical protein
MSDVKVKFSAEDQNLSKTVSNLQRDLERLDSKSKDASKGFDMSFGKIGLAAGVAGVAVKAGMMAVEAATAAASAVVAGFGQAIDLGGQLTDLSSRTGESAGSLLVLQRAFENTGVGAEKVGPSLNKLQKFMAEAAAGGAEQSATLNALGLSMSDLAGKTPSEQMQVLAQKIAGISDPAERARASMEVFGKSGGELLPLLNNFSGELEGARGQLGSLPDVMDRSARTFDDFGDGIGALSSKAMEFAAGFLESALPALNTFTAALSGIDAAGWGQALMKQIMSVADFLIGAFKAPMPAVEAIGSALDAGMRIAANNYLNSLIDAGNFLKAFFTSDLPGLIAGQLGNALIKMGVDFAKDFVDRINIVVKAFEQFFGTAIQGIVSFFSNSFNRIVNAFAADFQNAMSDPIGFVTGKFSSALSAVTKDGALTFQSSFDSASGSVLDKVSAGLGSVSDMYGERLKTGTAAIKDEFGNLISSIEPSTKDFFGAVPASAKAVEKLKEVEASGTKIREDFLKASESTDNSKKNTAAAVTDASAIAGSFNKAEGSTKKIREELSTSAKLLKDIEGAQKKDEIDRGGRLEKRAQNQISQGNFTGARNTARQIQRNETDVAIRGSGKNRDRRDLSDIGKDFGLRMQLGEKGSDFANRIKDAKEGNSYADKMGRSVRKGETFSDQDSISKMKKGIKDEITKQNVDKPNQDGSKTGDSGGSGGDKNKPQTLDAMVSALLDLVKKIEPKLPTSALAA